MMDFKSGMKVKHLLHGAGITTEEIFTVAKIDKNGGVWLDCGMGNRPIGPFIDGKKDGVFGFWSEIILVDQNTPLEQSSSYYDMNIYKQE